MTTVHGTYRTQRHKVILKHHVMSSEFHIRQLWRSRLNTSSYTTRTHLLFTILDSGFFSQIEQNRQINSANLKAYMQGIGKDFESAIIFSIPYLMK